MLKQGIHSPNMELNQFHAFYLKSSGFMLDLKPLFYECLLYVMCHYI